MLLVGIEAPESAYTRDARQQQLPHHLIDVARRIEGVGIDKEMILATGMLQTALAGKAGTLSRLVEIRNAQRLIHLFRVVLGIVVDTQNLYRIASLQLTQRPQAGCQTAFLVIGYHHYRHQRFLALQFRQPLTNLINNMLGNLTKRFPVNTHIFIVPMCHSHTVSECKYNNKIWKNEFYFVLLQEIIEITTFLAAWT